MNYVHICSNQHGENINLIYTKKLIKKDFHALVELKAV